jgi:hypothetical protein
LDFGIPCCAGAALAVLVLTLSGAGVDGTAGAVGLEGVFEKKLVMERCLLEAGVPLAGILEELMMSDESVGWDAEFGGSLNS